MDVALVGLLPRQAELIRSQYGSDVNLHFVGSGENSPRVSAAASSSDYVIVMTKFTPHDTQDILRNHEGLIFCNGGVSSAKLKLDELLHKDSSNPHA